MCRVLGKIRLREFVEHLEQTLRVWDFVMYLHWRVSTFQPVYTNVNMNPNC